MQHVRNVLWNFGMWRITKRELELELMKYDIDIRKPYLEWGEMLMIIAQKWNHNGRENEIRDTFKTFDKRDKGVINF